MFDETTIQRYIRAGWWGDEVLSQHVSRHATQRPDAPAYIATGRDGDIELSWADYDRRSTELACIFVGLGLERGTRVGMVLPDGPAVHIAYIAAEKSGLVVCGIGARAGRAEIQHLLSRTGAKFVLTHSTIGSRPATELMADLRQEGMPHLRHMVIPHWTTEATVDPVLVDGEPVSIPAPGRLLDGRRLGPNELFMLNSTSGTTGLPKCVMHTENRWFYFHQLAAASGQLTQHDVFFGAVPAPFGFGLWSAHFTPNILGCPTVVSERFNAEQALEAIERLNVTVLTCVSTQFIMMLNAATLPDRDLSSLRVMFTGGEPVPYARAAAFEEQTGATVLQFYGSNETGLLSNTSLGDSRPHRLLTAGRLVDEMNVRIFDNDQHEVVGHVRTGIPGCSGPATCVGYWNDDAANDQLFTPDGWMLMGDVVEVDPESYLQVVGRTSDIIIRGGKNVSAPAVEAEIARHPDVALVAAVAMPDEIFGERVCAYVVPKEGATVELADIVTFLRDRGITTEWFPERLEVVDELPMSSGGKVAKGELRADIQRRLKNDGDIGARL